ncbi:MAG: hypothetical protein AVDCRST_MAG60-1374, partial [uncultured Nocardioides sp.]
AGLRGSPRPALGGPLRPRDGRCRARGGNVGASRTDV